MALAIEPFQQYLFAGTNAGGVFLFSDSAKSWAEVNAGLENLCVKSLAATGTRLPAGTEGGVWNRPLHEMVEIPQPESPRRTGESAFRVSAFPGAGVAVGFYLDNTERVLVSVHSLSGAGVWTLVDQHLDSGPHRYFWNTRTLAAGIIRSGSGRGG